jgi:hypothetical protein
MTTEPREPIDAGRATIEASTEGAARVDSHVDSNVDASEEETGPEAGAACSVDGAPGQCTTVSACAALGDHTSTPGYCPGPEDVQCCIVTPNVADNPPTPAGYQLMAQSDVTSAMTAWAVSILDDPTMYPLFSTTTQTFGSLTVLALVEWHPPDFQNSAVHRGVTLYEPI